MHDETGGDITVEELGSAGAHRAQIAIGAAVGMDGVFETVEPGAGDRWRVNVGCPVQRQSGDLCSITLNPDSCGIDFFRRIPAEGGCFVGGVGRAGQPIKAEGGKPKRFALPAPGRIDGDAEVPECGRRRGSVAGAWGDDAI